MDRRFVAGVGTDSSDFAVARALVDMARAMGRSCVAEGVETATQFHVLRGIGVEAYQGWLMSPRSRRASSERSCARARCTSRAPADQLSSTSPVSSSSQLRLFTASQSTQVGRLPVSVSSQHHRAKPSNGSTARRGKITGVGWS